MAMTAEEIDKIIGTETLVFAVQGRQIMKAPVMGFISPKTRDGVKLGERKVWVGLDKVYKTQQEAEAAVLSHKSGPTCQDCAFFDKAYGDNSPCFQKRAEVVMQVTPQGSVPLSVRPTSYKYDLACESARVLDLRTADDFKSS